MKLSSLSLVKYALAAVLTLLFGTAYSQYPATGNKQRLGWQTTGDGLVYRGAIADTSTLDPSGLNNAWMLLDTVNGNLYAYRSKAWQLVSGGGGGGLTMPFDSVTFNINEGDASEQELKYSAEKGYLQYGGLDSVQIPLLPGIWYVRNDTSITIPKGTVVRASGTLGASGRIKVKHMIADGSIPAMYVLGIAMHDIATGADGYVMTQGKIRQVNTQAYSEGAVLYADVDTLGGLTQTEPGNGYLKLPIAFVVHSASNGTLAVRIDAGSSLRDLHDVDTTGRVDGSVLQYNDTLKYWKASTTAGITAGDTSVFARDFQISGTSGQVTYFNGSNTVTGDANLTWSAANKTLGINTTTTSGANIIIKNTQEPIRDAAWLPQQTFGADTTNWTAGTGWTFNGTQAVATAATGALTYTTLPDTIISGRAYEVTYTLAGYSAGTVTVAVGNATLALPAYNVTANAVLLTPTSATGGFRFTTSTFTGNLDNVSVVEISSPASVLFAGQDDGSATLYNPLSMPNSTTFVYGGGGRYITGTNNTAIGSNALRNNTTGANNVANGPNALANNTIGNSNIANGNAALFNNTTGGSNIANGNSALFSNTTGTDNVANGSSALTFNRTGSNNIANGNSALQNNTTGGSNIANGNSALRGNTTGNSNIANGTNALRSNTTGSSNIALGISAMYNTTVGDTLTGSNNIAIGNSAADNIRFGAAGNVAIGNQVELPTSNGINQGVYQNVLFFTGASGTGTTIAAGSRAGIKTNAPASDFHVAGEVRIDDLKPTGAPRNIVGSSSTGDLSTMAWGNGLTVSVGDTVLRVDTSLILPKVNVSGTTNYLAKFTGSNAVGNSVLFEDALGDIGVGTTDPSSFGNYRFIENTGRSLVNGGVFQTTNSDKTLIGQFYTADGQARLATNTNHRLAIWTNNTQRMLIDTVGNVGIATVSPSRPLHVNSNISMIIPSGATGTRPASGANGDIRYNTDNANFEWYSGTGWREAVNAARSPAAGLANRFSKFDANGLLDTSAVLTQSNGRIGIGVAPTEALQVNGKIKMLEDLLIYDSVRIGRGALNTITSNVAIGYRSLDSINAARLTNNIGIGSSALRNVRDTAATGSWGSSNIAIGASSMAFTRTGYNNTAIGVAANLRCTNCIENVAIGGFALTNNIRGAANMAIGNGSMLANIAGGFNVAIGPSALAGLTSGQSNVGFGGDAGRYVGASGTTPLDSATSSIFIGRNTRAQATSQTNQIVIGHQSVGNGSNTTTLGNSSTTATYIPAGKMYIGGTTAPTATLHVNGSLSRNAPVTVTANYTVAETVSWIVCDGTATIALTLPAAASWTGREIMVKTIQPYTVTSASANVVPIDGVAATNAILPATDGAWATLVSDGTNWIIMQQK